MRAKNIGTMLGGVLLILGTSGCVTTGSGITETSSQESVRLQTRLTLQDYSAMADEATDQMLASEVFMEGPLPLKIVVGRIRNLTDDDRIRVSDLHDHIEEYLINLRSLVHVMDEVSNDFEYVMKTELTSQRQFGADSQQSVTYELKVKLSTITGEKVGHWSVRKSLQRAARPLI